MYNNKNFSIYANVRTKKKANNNNNGFYAYSLQIHKSTASQIYKL